MAARAVTIGIIINVVLLLKAYKHKLLLADLLALLSVVLLSELIIFLTSAARTSS